MGIRTGRTESQRRLRVDHPHQAHAEDYQPSPSGVLDDILTGLDLDPKSLVFIDIGAGKGRVVCLAAGYPFQRVIGVELIPSLVSDCRVNLAAFSAPWQRCTHLECVEADAAEYRFPDAPLVVYLYNPFRPPVLRRLQQRLRDSFARSPRAIWILYYMPVHRHHFDGDPAFRVVEEARDWVVYRMAEAVDP